jgi:competence protein ComEC
MNARLLPLLGLLLAVACKQQPPAPAPPAAPSSSTAKRYLGSAPDGKLHVYFFDVGQGDSALIVSPEGRTVLVDPGPASAANHLVNRLPELLAARMDLVVLTHPAPDHYGALDTVQKVADPRRLLEPQLPESSSEYDALLTSLSSRGVQIFSPAPNPSQPHELTHLPLGGGAELTVLWPRAPGEPLLSVQGAKSEPAKLAQQESNSIVLRLTYGKTSVLFAGDARAETEAVLLKGGAELGSTLLKVGAHGADFATTAEFLRGVSPQGAIISVGAGNASGMPAPSALDRLKAANARIFRTDEDGEVHAVSDGQQFVVTTQRLHPGEPSDTQHVFSPEERSAELVVPILPPPTGAKPEPLKASPPKAVNAKSGSDMDLSRFGKVVDVSSKGTESSARPERPGRYVASRRSDVFHVPGCRNVRKIAPENLIHFSSREEAAKERRPARDCNP